MLIEVAVRPSVEKNTFGQFDDDTVIEGYTLKNSAGAAAKIITYGGIITELWMPDRDGKFADVVLGFSGLQGYLAAKGNYFGAIIGRVADRVAKARFNLDDREYSLTANAGGDTLHGGDIGFDQRVWTAQSSVEIDATVLRLTYLSPDGEEGFPGNLSVAVIYSLLDANALKVEYLASTDKPTLVNLTNHSYFNLAGDGDILGHVLTIDADSYLPIDAGLIPTGEVKTVKDTPLDFTRPTAIGTRIEALKPEPGGYDHYYVLNGHPGELRFAARVADPSSGRQMEVWTTEPGVQLYSAIHLDRAITGKRGRAYPPFSALCLETQHFPDAINHSNFPSMVLRPSAEFRSETIYKFSAQ